MTAKLKGFLGEPCNSELCVMGCDHPRQHELVETQPAQARGVGNKIEGEERYEPGQQYRLNTPPLKNRIPAERPAKKTHNVAASEIAGAHKPKEGM